MAEQTRSMKWPDFSHYGMRMVSVLMPTGDRRLVMQGGEKHASRVSRLGFRNAGNNLWIRSSAKITGNEISAIFGPDSVPVRSMSYDQIFFRMQKRRSEETPEDVRTKLAINESRPLGVNYLGQEVFQGAEGRFVRGKAGTVTRESDSSPAVFLRAASDEDLELCADGLINEIMAGRIFREDDISRFADIVHGEAIDATDIRMVLTHDAIGHAIARRMIAETADAGEDAFSIALRLHEGLPPLPAEYAEKITTAPIGVVVQRLLGYEKDKTILVPSLGNGAMTSSVTGCKIQTMDDGNGFVRQENEIEVVSGFGRHDMFAGNIEFRQMDEARVINGTRTQRTDHAMVMESLAARAPGGRSVYILKSSGKHGELDPESRNLVDWVAARYSLDGIAEIDGSLFGKGGTHSGRYILCVGKRGTGQHLDLDRIHTIFDYGALWEWSSELIAAGQKEMEAKVRVENGYQSPYIPASSVTPSASMIPRNLSGPTRKALSAVEEEYGDIDDFVASETGIPREDLGEYLSSEQVDAVALAISAIRKGRGFIEADQTGMGKGRVLATMARWAAMHGKRTIFITERSTLFSDFYRDINDTGSMDLFKPFILNDGASIMMDGKKVIPSTGKELIRQAIESREIPAEYNLMMATYSQFNRPQTNRSFINEKAELLASVADDAILILDESHNAAGESNINSNITTAVNAAFGTVYSSATFAKDSGNFRIYSSVIPGSVSSGSIPEVLSQGGDPLAEVFSAMLVEDGVMIRRELDLSDLRFDTVVDADHMERNERLSDKLSEILEAMGVLGSEIDGFVNEKNRLSNISFSKTQAAQSGNKNPVGYFSVNFGSRLYTVMRQFMMAIKTDLAADLAVKALTEGRKPIIVIENTQEALIRSAVNKQEDLAKEMLEVNGLTEEEQDVVLDTMAAASGEAEEERTLDMPVTFRDILHRVLENMGVVYTREGAVITESEKLDIESVARFKESISIMIDALPDVPVSPIDILKDRIESGGFSFGEISGRSIGIEQLEDGTQVIRKVKGSSNKTRTIHQFNEGYIDALVLTTAGSTGISLHAGEHFSDQRQREMIELQIPNNVATRVQCFGRANRKGQVCPPVIRTISSGLPSEIRLLSMQNAKLRELSANTTSNRDSSILDQEMPDLLNKVGSEICRKFLMENLNIAARLSIPPEKLSDDFVKYSSDKLWHANQLTSRIGMLPVREQRSIYADITSMYRSEIADMEARGVNPFKSEELDIGATILKREAMFSANIGGDSVFDQPVYVTTVTYEEEFDRIDAAAIEKMIEAARLDLGGDVEAAVWNVLECLDDKKQSLLERTLSKEFNSVSEALNAEGMNATKSLDSRIHLIRSMVPALTPGNEISITTLFGERRGVITKLDLAPPGREHFMGEYNVRISFPGDRSTWMSLYSLQSDPGFKANPITPVTSAMMEQFANVSGTRIRRVRKILDGNMFEAARWSLSNKKGSSVVYTDASGQRHRGVMLPDAMAVYDINSAVPIGKEVLEKFIMTSRTPVWTAGKPDPKRDIAIGVVGIQPNHYIRVFIPKGKAFERISGSTAIPDLQSPARDRRNSIKQQSISVPFAHLNQLIEEIYDAGFSFFAKPSDREAIESIIEEIRQDSALMAKAIQRQRKII